MTLGEQLKATLNELNEAQIIGIEAKATANIIAVREKETSRKRYINTLCDYIFDTIKEGKVPLKKEINHDHQDWLRNAQNDKAEFQSIWYDAVAKLKAEHLHFKIIECHNGSGMTSWLNITVVPIKPVQPPIFRGKSA